MKLLSVFAGVNSYEAGFFPSLRFCSKDASHLSQVLSRRVAGHAPVECLVDRVPKSEFEAALQLIEAETLTPSDSILVFFAGHGFSIRGRDYLAFTDTKDDTESALDVQDLLARLRATKAGKILVVLDCCREIDTQGTFRGARQPFRGASIQDTMYDVAVFVACGVGQVSFENSELQHGLFSHALIEALENDRGHTLTEINQYVRQRVASLCHQYDYAGQMPELRGPFSLATYDLIKGDNVTLRTGRRQALVLSGPTNAGKTTVGREVAAQLGWPLVEMSTYAKKRFDSRQDKSLTTIQDFVEHELWGNGNYDVIARDALTDISASSVGVVIAGARRPEEVETILEGDFQAAKIYLYSSARTRFNRYLNDIDDFYSSTFDNFLKRNLREYGWGLAKIGIMGETEILDTDAVNLQQAVDAVISKLREKLEV